MPCELGVDRRSPREKRLETEGGGGWRGVPPRSRARAWGLVPEPPALNVFHALGPLIRALCTINGARTAACPSPASPPWRVSLQIVVFQ